MFSKEKKQVFKFKIKFGKFNHESFIVEIPGKDSSRTISNNGLEDIMRIT